MWIPPLEESTGTGRSLRFGAVLPGRVRDGPAAGPGTFFRRGPGHGGHPPALARHGPAASIAWLEGLLGRQSPGAVHAAGAVAANWITSWSGLDDEMFQRVLVPLRRTFGGFSAAEVRRVIDNLAVIDRGAARQLAAVADVPLSEEEIRDWNTRLGELEFLGED